MKILYASDMHADFDKLEIFCEYAKKSDPDLIMASGDIQDIAYNDKMLSKRHHILSKILFDYMIRTESGLKRLTPYEVTRALPIIAEKIYEKPSDKNLEELAEEYLKSLDFFEGNMDLRYDLAKSILDKTGLEYKALPGNHDKDLQMTCLKETDMHKKTLEKNGIIISCFGGANDFQYGDVVPFGIPVELTIPFNEYTNSEGKIVSEIFNFLIREKPDIAFTHIPPRGIRDLAVNPVIRHSRDDNIIRLLRQGGPALLDYVIKNGNSKEYLKRGGSLGLEKYLQQGFTKIVCCGHIHESIGAEKIDTDKGPVIIFNAGSLKEGYFSEVSIDEDTKKLDKISLYKIKGKLLLLSDLEEKLDIDNVNLIMQYFLSGNELKKLKIDLEDKYDY